MVLKLNLMLRVFLSINIENRYSGTFLPEVAQEENWDKETTLKYLVKKSGYYGKLGTIVDMIKVTRYQSVKTVISYEEYLELKEKKI
jgi:AMMECR1 domain-containing protein